jgi:hypothetical protein
MEGIWMDPATSDYVRIKIGEQVSYSANGNVKKNFRQVNKFFQACFYPPLRNSEGYFNTTSRASQRRLHLDAQSIGKHHVRGSVLTSNALIAEWADWTTPLLQKGRFARVQGATENMRPPTFAQG